VARGLSGEPRVEEVVGGARTVVLDDDELRVTVPWQGRLFDIIAGVAAEAVRADGAATLGLVVPVRDVAAARVEVVLVADHVNLRVGGPGGRAGPPPSPP
jgi:hypothetical protein